MRNEKFVLKYSNFYSVHKKEFFSPRFKKIAQTGVLTSGHFEFGVFFHFYRIKNVYYLRNRHIMKKSIHLYFCWQKLKNEYNLTFNDGIRWLGAIELSGMDIFQVLCASSL